MVYWEEIRDKTTQVYQAPPIEPYYTSPILQFYKAVFFWLSPIDSSDQCDATGEQQ